MKQANTTSEEELDEILDNMTEFLYFKNADGEFVPVNFKDNPVFKEDRDALLAWRDAAVVKARKEQTFTIIRRLAKAGAISDHAASTALNFYIIGLDTHKEKGQDSNE